VRDWLARYRAGEHQQVWCEMRCAGPRALRQRRLEAEEVALLTVHAVMANAIRIEGELRRLGYEFVRPPGLWSAAEGVPETTDAASACHSGRAIGNPRHFQADLDEYVRYVASVPIALHAFWGRVGWLDFRGQHPGGSTAPASWAPLVVNPPAGLIGEFEAFLDTGPATGFRFPLAPGDAAQPVLKADMQFGADARLTTGEWFVDHLRPLTQAGGVFQPLGADNAFINGLRRIRADWIPF
jgi:hypothetical protein